MKIESRDQDVQALLSSGYYQIPRFQRPYSWTRENIQEFWDDIVREEPLDYFIGPMVVYEKKRQHFGIVDGQQRMTTITILLCVLRDTYKSLGLDDLADGTNSLIEKRNIDNVNEFILTTESSYPYFQDHIQKYGEPETPASFLEEEKTLREAYFQLTELVDAVIASIDTDTTLSDTKRTSKYIDKLNNIRQSLLGLKLILVKLEKEDDAYIIFETINTRGKNLSLTDLVKNHITKHLRSKNVSVDQAKFKWEKIIEAIQGSSIDLDTDNFIYHFWLSKYSYIAAKRVFREIKKQIRKNEAKQFLGDLLNDANIYRSIHETTYGGWEKQEKRIVEALKALMLFRVRQQTPCVLSHVREYRAGKIKKKHLEDALVAIEKFHFFFNAVTSQRSSGGIATMYASFARRLSDAPDTQAAAEIIRDLKNELRKRFPSLDEVKVLFPEIIYTEKITKQRALIKYILVGLDKGDGAMLSKDYDSLTIEHIIPQSMIGNGGYTDEIIGQIGNMLLVTKELNKKLNNKTFTEKKEILIKENYDLPDEIKNTDSLGEEDIKARTLKIAEHAYNNIWKI